MTFPQHTDDRQFLFRIYNADRTAEMQQIGKQLAEMVQKHCPDRCTVEYVDVLEDPDRAVEQGVFLTPTVVKELPEPVRRVIGDLGDTRKTLVLMGVLVEEKGQKPA